MAVKYLETVWTVLSEYDRLLIFGSLLLVSAYLFAETMTYGPDARLMPLLIVSVLILLLVVRVSLEVLTYADFDLRGFLPTSIGAANGDEEDSIFDEIPQDEEPSNVGAQLRGILWVAVFIGAFYLFGVIYTIPVLLFLFIFVEHDTSILRNLVIVGLFSLFVYVMFVRVLNIRIYYGVFEISLVGLF